MKNPWKLTTLILALALMVALGLPLIGSANAHDMRQPHMKAALTATSTALRQLNKSAPNKAGHRAKAVVHLNAARSEIMKGIEAGAKHKH
jgi:hypothetical protein